MKILFFIGVATALCGNTFDDLFSRDLINEGERPKLHIGCGENRIKGYVNIDFSPSEHTIQDRQGADYFFDITKLTFPAESVLEVRNHHVFEHFSRPVALAMLTAWQYWLCEEGKIYIETPDFEKGMLRFHKTKKYATKQAILRHLFGSHEEYWAVHWDGWYAEKYRYTLEKLGFTKISVRHESYKMLDNIHVRAEKTISYSLGDLRVIAKNILRDSMVDRSPSEQKMWRHWCKLYDQALDQMIISEK